MKPPPGVIITPQPLSRPGYLDAIVTIDLDAIREAARQIGTLVRPMNEAMRNFNHTFRALGKVLAASANDEVRVSGLEARYLVRGGFMYNEDDLGLLVRWLMQSPEVVEPEDDDLLSIMLTPASRARLAVAAIRGFVLSEERNRP